MESKKVAINPYSSKITGSENGLTASGVWQRWSDITCCLQKTEIHEDKNAGL